MDRVIQSRIENQIKINMTKQIQDDFRYLGMKDHVRSMDWSIQYIELLIMGVKIKYGSLMSRGMIG